MEHGAVTVNLSLPGAREPGDSRKHQTFRYFMQAGDYTGAAEA
jgi:hypothetical protein